MKNEKMNFKEGSSFSLIDLHDHRVQIHEAFFSAWSNPTYKSLKEVFTEDVKIINSCVPGSLGIKGVFNHFTYFNQIIEYNNIEDISATQLAPKNIKETDMFGTLIYDFLNQDLFIVFKMTLRGEKIAMIEILYNDFHENMKKYFKGLLY